MLKDIPQKNIRVYVPLNKFKFSFDNKMFASRFCLGFLDRIVMLDIDLKWW